MAHSFRLIYDREHGGAANMARDEAISRAVSAGAEAAAEGKGCDEAIESMDSGTR